MPDRLHQDPAPHDRVEESAGSNVLQILIPHLSEVADVMAVRRRHFVLGFVLGWARSRGGGERRRRQQRQQRRSGSTKTWGDTFGRCDNDVAAIIACRGESVAGAGWDRCGGAMLLRNSLVPWDNDIRRFVRGFGYGYENTVYEKFCTRPTGGANLLMFQQFVETSTNLRSRQICVFVDTARKVRR